MSGNMTKAKKPDYLVLLPTVVLLVLGMNLASDRLSILLGFVDTSVLGAALDGAVGGGIGAGLGQFLGLGLRRFVGPKPEVDPSEEFD